VYYNIMADISAKTRLAVVQLWDTPNWKSPIFDFFSVLCSRCWGIRYEIAYLHVGLRTLTN